MPVSRWIIDEKVFSLYKDKLSGVVGHPFLLRAEEENKSFATVKALWEWFYQERLDRHARVGIIGGGLTLDVAGFASATWHRGLIVYFIPTTLLAQVDAAHGGKTAFNFKNIKNAIGTFYFPRAIIIAPSFLKTLDEAHYRSGLAEMVKHALLSDYKHFERLLNLPESLLAKQWLPLIRYSIRTKYRYIARDPYERKETRIFLNLGHTLGHALEGYAIEHQHDYTHGECVMLGLLIELLYKFESTHPIVKSLKTFIEKHKYPTDIMRTPFDALIPYLLYDKKREEKQLRMVLIEDIGKPYLHQIRAEELPKLQLAYEKASTLLRN